jgi:hypothetical protein
MTYIHGYYTEVAEQYSQTYHGLIYAPGRINTAQKELRNYFRIKVMKTVIFLSNLEKRETPSFLDACLLHLSYSVLINSSLYRINSCERGVMCSLDSNRIKMQYSVVNSFPVSRTTIRIDIEQYYLCSTNDFKQIL